MHVTLLGATGLIGNFVLHLLLKDKEIKSVTAVVRRNISTSHPKLKVEVIDFSNEKEFKPAMSEANIIISAVGTTQKQVSGDKDQYRKVDYDIPVKAAEFAEIPTQFLLVSAIGADSSSNNFYLQLKGEVEDAIRKTNIPSISIFRPSLLLGNRDEFRLGEKLAQWIMPLFKWITPSKYKPIHAEDVAKAIVQCIKLNKPGVSVLHYSEMKSYKPPLS